LTKLFVELLMLWTVCPVVNVVNYLSSC
jgi:hypothetical protein